MAKCREVMTPDPSAVEATEPLTRVAEIMKSQNVGAVPVIDSTASRRLIGIVTDRDIVVKVLADGRDVRSARAEDAMTSGPTACREDQDIGDAVHQMAERQVRRIPVVDAEGRLSGIIAQADVATRVNRDRTTGMLVEAISEPVPQRKPV